MCLYSIPKRWLFGFFGKSPGVENTQSYRMVHYFHVGRDTVALSSSTQESSNPDPLWVKDCVAQPIHQVKPTEDSPRGL